MHAPSPSLKISIYCRRVILGWVDQNENEGVKSVKERMAFAPPPPPSPINLGGGK